MEIRGRDAEKRSAAAARIRRGLSWKAWAADLDEHLLAIEKLFSPRLFIIGGGVSKRSEKFIPRLTVKAEVVPAAAPQRRRHRRRGDGGGGAARRLAGPDGRCRRADGHRRRPRRRRGRPDLRGRRAARRRGRREVPLGWPRTSIEPSPPRTAAFEGGWGSMAASDRGRHLFRFAQAVRDHEDELATAREPADRQAHRRGALGDRAGREGPRVLRRRDDQAARLDHPGDPSGPRLHAARADRRGRAHRPLELPDA